LLLGVEDEDEDKEEEAFGVASFESNNRKASLRDEGTGEPSAVVFAM